MKLRILFLSLGLCFLQETVVKCQTVDVKSPSGDEEDVIALWMPFVNTTSEDEYHCLGMDVAWETRYITKYVPHASQKSVHHILIYGCTETINTPKDALHGSWKCLNDHPVQAACTGGTKFLYAWAKDAPPLQLPEDVGFLIGSKTAVKGIFIQIHYSAIVQNDNSGISLIVSPEPRKYAAGIMLLAGGGQVIPPHEPVVNVNVLCQYMDDIVLHPFGFRTHAHGLGTVISGWYMKPEDQVAKKWTLMGKQSPQNPQAFYKMAEAHNITKGTVFGARCVYNSTTRDTITMMGPTHNDEMCNFYMMYYADRSTVREGCTDVDFNLRDVQLPASASLPLPTELIQDHHHHHTADITTVPPPIAMGMPVGENEPDEATSTAGPRRRPSLEPDQDLSNGHGRDGEDNGNDLLQVDKKSDLLRPLPHAGMEHSEHENTITGENKEFGYEEVPQWSTELRTMQLGQISGIALDHSDTNVYIFHRRDHVWDGSAFSFDNTYAKIDQGPIRETTILVVDKVTGKTVNKLGDNMFYMPHGITVGRDGDLWITDVALHQVIRLKDGKPTMILGVKLVPGHDGQHFCKPTMVALQTNGEFYVGDGYCNSRVIKFTPDGRYISHIGTAQANFGLASGSIAPRPEAFYIPHDVKLSDDESVLFVADRENGRVQTFRTSSNEFLKLYQVPEFGFKVYAVDVAGDLMVAVNGLGMPSQMPVQGILVNISSGMTINVFNSKSTPLVSPHAVAITRDQSCIFVVELNGNILQFHQIGAKSSAPVPSPHPHDPLLQQLSGVTGKPGHANSSDLTSHLSDNPFMPVPGGYSYLLLSIFIAPLLLLCCGLGFCCLRKSRRPSSHSKWKDVLYTYKASAKDIRAPRDFKNSKEGFRPLRQEDRDEDDSDSEEEVFSQQKSQRRANIA